MHTVQMTKVARAVDLLLVLQDSWFNSHHSTLLLLSDGVSGAKQDWHG